MSHLAQLIQALPKRNLDASPIDMLDGTAPPSTAFGQQLRDTGVLWRFATLLGTHALETLFLIAAWTSIGHGALSGRLDHGWLIAGALCLISIVPLRLANTWLQGVLAIGIGGLLKQRLLAGAMTIDSDLMRRQGAGQLLSQVIEAENIERLGASGGLATLLAVVDLFIAIFLFGRGAAAWQQVAVFLAWVALTAAIAVWNIRVRANWTQTRLDMTHRLVEKMSGHRTRLAQQSPVDWHDEEDTDSAGYLAESRRLDRTSAWLSAAVPRGYLAVAVLAFAPAFVGSSIAPAQLAITIGAILFSYAALVRLAFGCTRLGTAWVSWCCVRPLFDAAARAVEPGIISGGTTPVETVLDAQEIVFSHRSRTEPILKGCNVKVRRGDFVLLEGSSGSGKSTLAALLAGFRQPSSGLILANGLDWQTLGEDGWRRRIVCAPQYHENHIMSASLGFNLLMGRPYPHSKEDMEEAWQICEELGLGQLLKRMPGGLEQMVGETGWQLSQGERSRIFLARALLQGGDAVLLDESFAALDPDNMRQCLECVFRRAKTLMVIAHP
jgi:ATP-binding cassette, subfamily B, bacterial